MLTLLNIILLFASHFVLLPLRYLIVV